MGLKTIGQGLQVRRSKTRRDKTRRGKTRRDKTGQDEEGQDEKGQDEAERGLLMRGGAILQRIGRSRLSPCWLARTISFGSQAVESASDMCMHHAEDVFEQWRHLETRTVCNR